MIVQAAALACLWALSCAPAMAHPHAFVEAQVTVVFDEQGLAGFQQRWVIDEVTTFAVLDLIGEDGDGRLSEAEQAAVKQESFDGMKEFGYFTAVVNQGRSFEVEWVTGFQAHLHEGVKLVYSFFVPCHVKAAARPKEVKVAVYDESFYTYVSYVEEGGAIDPTDDPMFGNQAAGPKPGDFQRFSKSVGLSEYQGGVKLQGPLERFTIEAGVEEAQDMAYFEGQIVPQAFRVTFSAP
jgi:ABC-type uncharacterized transport system substrate-binding protein